jgi:hypothetical protein
MKRMLAVVIVLLALPASAQERRASSGGGTQAAGGGSHGTAGSSGGGQAAPRGGSSGSGGAAVSHGSTGGGSISAGGSSGRADTGGRHSAGGSSGVAVSRGERGSYSSGGRHGDAGTVSSAAASPTAASGTGSDARAAARGDGSQRNARSADGAVTAAPSHGRARGNEPIVGTAVPRGSVPPASRPGGVNTVGSVGYYPWWWFGGAGFYGGYWGFNNDFGYPYGGAPYYGYYDPWFGGYPDMPDSYTTGSSGWTEEGSLKLKIKPKDAEVFVDGFYVGLVDDFDGLFQKLHIDAGPHRVEVRAAGYEPLVIEVRITADHTTTYQGELKRIQ